MDREAVTFADELVAGLERMVALGEQLPDQRFRLSGQDLARVLPWLDRCRAVMEADTFAIALEAQARGEVAASQAGSTAAWVAAHCPCLDARQAAVVAKAVLRLAPAPFSPVRDAVLAGRISPTVALTVRSEFDAMDKMLAPGAEEAVIAGLVAIGRSDGCRGVRALRQALLARYGLGDQLQQEEDRLAGATTLTAGRDLGGDLHEYRLRLGPEGRAILEAAIGPLSAPRPDRADGSTPGQVGADRAGGSHAVGDTRTAEQRRGDALVEVCRRATAVVPTTTPSGVKATVFVTIRLDDLRDHTRPGTVFGGLDTGTVLGPETVRRMACDGGIVPVVLGACGEVLDVGRTVRLFTAGQQKALWFRDRHCTFPGCQTAAHWCDAHHIRHWADGGPTDLSNAALLCGRHHTIVHRDRLTATLSHDGITWDVIPGSYDRVPHDRPTGQRMDASTPRSYAGEVGGGDSGRDEVGGGDSGRDEVGGGDSGRDDVGRGDSGRHNASSGDSNRDTKPGDPPHRP